MADKKVIAVVGATGAQGGGLARAILDDARGGFALRALTRNPVGEKAQALAERGAQVVAADLDDRASVPTRAFEGAYGAFCVTNYWEDFSPEKEHGAGQGHGPGRQGHGAPARDLVDLRGHPPRAPLDDTRMPTLPGSTRCPTSTPRARPTQLLRARGAHHVPADLVLLGQPRPLRHGPRKAARRQAGLRPADGRQEAARASPPTTSAPAHGIFKRGREPRADRRCRGRATDRRGQMASALSRAIGQEVVYSYVPPEVYRTFGFPGADDLAKHVPVHDATSRGRYCAVRDVAFCRTLYPGLQTFAQGWPRTRIACRAARLTGTLPGSPSRARPPRSGRARRSAPRSPRVRRWAASRARTTPGAGSGQRATDSAGTIGSSSAARIRVGPVDRARARGRRWSGGSSRPRRGSRRRAR